jgi:hypothetical protein
MAQSVGEYLLRRSVKCGVRQIYGYPGAPAAAKRN